jgi:hypothetical protein
MRLAEDEVGSVRLDDRHHGEFHGSAPVARDHPDPDPQHLAAARQFRAVEIDTRLWGAAVPPDDKIWLR